jgi:tyrosyl-tRNA synthetase
VTAGPAAERPEGSTAGLVGLLEELEWRGMLHATTPGLPGRLATGRPIAGYNGFDPSGPSLHIGHLVPIMGLAHLQRHGGRPVALVGGATGMVGDPSGRSAERNLLSLETLEANVAGIRTQLERFLDFSGASGARLVNNLDWLGPISVLDFLRDVGKHFTVPYMLAKDSVQVRLGGGLSFTEFSYMLLQAADFRHLYRSLGVEMQMGGADQWGNITAGLELIRRSEGEGAEAHGLAYPLFTDPSGAKFGKTAEGTSVWLDAERTSPYAFYQYWLATEDADVGGRLRFFTLLRREEIEALETATRERPEAREAQRALARDVTARVHGEAVAAEAQRVSQAVFGAGLLSLDRPAFEMAATELPNVSLPRGQLTTAAGTAVASGIVESLGEARRLIAQGGLYLNEDRVTDPTAPPPDPLHGAYLVVRKGKRQQRIVRITD